MLKTGSAYLEGLRDGRAVFIGSDRVDDVTTHPAFRNVARSIASIYDLKRDTLDGGAMSYEEDGDRHSIYFLKASSREQLQQRSDAHARIAAATCGLLGRSPDYVASFVTGMAIRADIFGERSGNIRSYYQFIRDNDLYLAHAVVSPRSGRDPEYFLQQNRPVPTCRVIRETDEGVIVRGMKMLATGAAVADEILIGNILPLSPEAKAESVTFAIPCHAPGLSLWSRKTVADTARSEFDAPLAWRFDEPDCIVILDDVLVPWSRVFVHNDTQLSRALYIQTPCHSYGNHQSGIRFLSKLRLIVGLASKVAQSSGADSVPQVRETLGRLSSYEALLEGVMAGQIHSAEPWGDGYLAFNRRMMYAQMNWCADNYAGVIDCLRELCGGSALQMPADSSVINDVDLGGIFETYWHTPQMGAADRMQLFKLAWDIVGSEFGGRHLQYERFYGGPAFIVRNHSYREADWASFHAVVESLMTSKPLP